jgi:1,2-diacylglycerol 3-alpha-glucosyltransferase
VRIAIAGQTYKPALNGQGVFTIHLAEGLAQLGHQVMVLMPSDRGRAYQAVQNKVLVQAITAVSLAPFYPQVHVTPAPGFQVGPRLDEFRPELVHIQDHYPLCRSMLQAARRRDLPVIGTNHFLPENILLELPLFSRWQIPLDRFLWKWVLNVFDQVDIVTTPTETAAKILGQQNLQVPVQAISCGVDLRYFQPDAQLNRVDMRLRYGLDPQCTLLLYVGRLDREKRVDLLLQALHRLHRPDLQLAVAGRGARAATLQTLTRRLELDQQVVFTGYVPDQDLVALLNSADIFCMPSDAELQSIATLEAMGTGRPIIAAAAGALPELVKNGVNGYLFRADEAEDAARCIAKLADQPEAWAAMGAASRTMVQPHDLSQTLQHYERLYCAYLDD